MKARLAIGAAVAGLMCLAAAEAKELTYGAFIKDTHPAITDGIAPMLREIETLSGGSLKWRIVAGGQIVNERTTLKGIGDKVVDAGLVVPSYTQKQLPALNILFTMQLYGRDEIAVAGAANETILLDCPECQAEHRRNNSLILASYTTTPFILLCRPEIRTIEDFQGKKIRTVGANTRIIKRLGGVAVALPVSDAVQAMERGAIDCSVGSMAWLTGYGFIDVAKYVIDDSMGAVAGVSQITINRKVWDGMTAAEKTAMVKPLARGVAGTVVDGYQREARMVAEEAKKRGIKILHLGKPMDDLIQQQMAEEDQAVLALGAELGLKNTQAVMDAYKRALVKWTRLAKEIGNDSEKLTAALQREIFDKIDPSKL